jgi:hypothetical protein
VIVGVGAEVAGFEVPSTLLAVTVISIVEPTSAAVGV